MQLLGDKTVIRHTYDNTVATGLFDEVLVVTDSDIIFPEIVSHGGNAVMSLRAHESGSDRIAEAVAGLEVDVVVNVQGDEPFIQKKPLADLLEVFSDHTVQVASLMHKIDQGSPIDKPQYGETVVDLNGFALAFVQIRSSHLTEITTRLLLFAAYRRLCLP